MQKTKSFQDINISNFIFIITPTDAVFSKPTEHKRTLSLEKGMQTLGTLQQSIPIMSKERLIHKFDQHSTKIAFRIINDKSLNYQWSVYKVYDGGELEEIQSMQFSILNFWKNFISEYEKQISNLITTIKDDKQHKKIMQAWKEISDLSQEKKALLRVNSKKADFKLNFNIQAKSILDEQVEEYEKQKMFRKQRQFQRSQIRKSALNATYAFMQDDKIDEVRYSQKLKKTKNESSNSLSIPSVNNSRNFLTTIHETQPANKMQQELKKNASSKENITISKKKSNEDFQNSLQISSQIHSSLKRVNSLEKRDTFYEREELSLSSIIKHEKPKQAMISQANSKLESVKMTVLYAVLGFIMFWLMYNLMHHTSKVEYRNK